MVKRLPQPQANEPSKKPSKGSSNQRMESVMDLLSALPADCIATILSRTSPEDACRLSLLCKTFLSAATSDAVWGGFLPADIVSSYLAADLRPKRELYFRLCDFPLLIDGNKMNFSLERRSGKKCYMLSARKLSIVWGDTPRYWGWESPPEYGELFIGAAELEEMLHAICKEALHSMGKSPPGYRPNQRMESGMDLSALPEGCIATILSLTSPEDACRLSLLCKPFLSAATSDAVWGAFLPADIVSSYLAAGLGSKRELYFRLCDFPLLIDGNKMSFSLERRSGKKCYMLSARALSIIWARGDTPQYWTWGPPPEFFSPNVFQEVACLRLVWWFEINGEINTRMLSPKTNYAAYFVFKWCSNFFGFNSCPLVVYIGVTGGEKTVRCIDFNPVKYSRITPQNDLEYPVDGITMGTERADGWTEIEIGEFFNLGDEDFNLEISLQEMSNKQKRGLLVQGIEVRPKRG